MNRSFLRPFVRRAAVILSLATLTAAPALRAAPAVVLNEIHYHPVEKAAFDANGQPLLHLTNDVHEFVEIYNPGFTNVSLAGWRLTGEVEYDFPTNAVIAAGRYLAIAKNPARLLSISQYALNATNVLGPYQGNLGNRSGTVRLRDALDNTLDSVSYSGEFPWAIGADALGADDEWTGLNSSNFQYRGRSLERVSIAWTANDPANWLASPAPGNPSPARVNTVTRPVPKPVVTAFAAYQDADGAALIRANQLVRIDCTFSATNLLSAVAVEYFLDDINVNNETRTTANMSVTGAPGEGRYTVVLPGRADRTIVRYRIRANRGTGVETVSPRADDPFAWHAYFVAPARVSTNRIYDCFISSASLNTLATNLNPANPSSVDISVLRRINTSTPAGVPSAYWNATQPAVFVVDGVVYDAQARYHGSQYRRAPGNNSWKWQFPRYQRLDGREGIFISDNDDITVACGILHRMAGLPQSYTRWIDFYLNNDVPIRRMDQDEMDDGVVERLFAEQRIASPELPKESSGEFYKSQGNFWFTDPTGPFGYGGYHILPAIPPYWAEWQRYEHTFGLQMNGWKGHVPFQEMLHGLWSSRGDTNTAPNPNIPALRAWLAANFDVDATLASMAIRVWTVGWDNFNHNHFIWRRETGKWAALQWDFDGELSTFDTNSSIYLSEHGAPLIYTTFGQVYPGYTRPWVDANWINDSFFKAYREEYKRKLFLLNNTLLNPTNITAIGLGSYRTFADGRFASVNSQVNLGPFHRPRTPTNVAPSRGEAALPPAIFVSSPYSHPASPTPAHGSTTWWIRATNGTYAAPLFKTTSTSNLTSLPIPFDKLTLGQSYYWRCAYTDTNGHPSFESAETLFIYGAGPTFSPVFSIDANTIWRFNTNGFTLPSNWRTLAYDDSAWAQGAALIADDAGPLPEPVRTPISRASRICTYFRKTFVFDGDPASAQLRIRHIVDDGLIVFLNGAEIHRLGINAGIPVGNNTSANRAVTDAVYEGPYIIFPTNLMLGTNVIAGSFHRNSNISPDTAFGLSLEVSTPPMPGSVVLNEILADNRASVTNAGQQPDYIELFNTTAVTQSLAGLSLSDNAELPGKYLFPPGASIPPNAHLVVWCDNETNSPGLHTGFALDNDGQTVALFTILTNGYVLADAVTFGLQIPDHAIARSIDGSGAWTLAQPTPGAVFSGVASGDPAALKINEWMATAAGGPDWFELFNPAALPVALEGLLLSDDLASPTNTRIAPLSFIAPSGFRQFIADEDETASAAHVDFKLNGTGDSIGLFQPDGTPIDTVSFGPQTGGVSEGRLPDGAGYTVPFPNTASPGEPNYVALANVLVNEVLSHSDPPLMDSVELFNPTGLDADISGWWLSDDKLSPRKYQLPLNSVVPAGSFLTLYESQFNASPGAPGNFAFSSAHGDQVYLSAADGGGNVTGARAEANFAPAETGVSHGRFTTSQGVVFTALANRSFDGANSYAQVGPVIISEVMFHPPDFPGGFDNSRDEYIELRSIASTNVALFDPANPTNRWRLRDAVSFTFPPGVTLAPGEIVLIVGFDPVADTNELTGFLDTYGSIGVRIFGPWSGKLDNSGNSVELVKPDRPVTEPGPDFGFVPSILVERVRYSDSFPWPGTADGTGLSLMRSVPGDFGDEPLNWFAWVPTPGGLNIYNALPIASLTSPTEGFSVLGPTAITLTATASDSDGSVTRVEYFDGTNKIGQASTAPYTFTWNSAAFGAHVLTARARDNGNAAGVSAPVNILVYSQPPTVALTTPTNGAIFVAGNSVAISATTTDPDTSVALVEYLVDGAKVAEASTPPYPANWTTTPGSHQLAAVAIDTTGVRGTSAVSRVFVQSVAFLSTIVASNSAWRYLDTGVDPGTTWTNLTFNDTAWGTGAAELGFGDATEGRPEATLITRVGISGTTNLAYYFRQKFVLNSLAGMSNLVLNVMRDDGAIAWLNGVEVFRDNMPAGTPNNLTAASAAISGAAEAAFIPTNVAVSRLRLGTNILAIQVHQSGIGSSDLSFDAQLRVAPVAFLGPAITAAPGSLARAAGDNATFNVSAIGSGPLAYQWRFNGNPLPNQTNTALTLINVQPAQAGAYSVTVSNGVAVVTSAPAALAVGNSDIDGDGLPDSWEIANGLDPFNPADSQSDSDADRMSNQAEFLAGTDPMNAQSVLRITSLTFGRAAVLGFNAGAGAPYTIEFKDALAAGSWTPLATLSPVGTAQTRRLADPVVGFSRFYRLSTPQPPALPLRIETITIDSAVLLNFTAISNRAYVIEFTDTPGAGPWSPLLAVPSQPTTRPVTVADPTTSAARVYRILLSPAP